MENRTDPITAQQKRFRRRRLKKGCTAGLLALLLLGGAIGGYFYIKEKNGQETGSGSTVAYRVQQVTRGSVQTSLSASGTLSAIDTQTLTAAYGATVTEVLAAAGDTVETGQLLVALEPEEEGELVTLLEENKQSLAKTQRLSNQLYLRNGASGTVKDLKLEAGSDAAAVRAAGSGGGHPADQRQGRRVSGSGRQRLWQQLWCGGTGSFCSRVGGGADRRF